MSKSKDLLQSLDESLTQYNKMGDQYYRPTGDASLEKVLETGIYNIRMDMMGVLFEKTEVKTDALIKINTSKYNNLMEEIKKFRESTTTEKYNKLGFVNKRAFIIHSIPGTGKSCLLKQVMEDVTKAGDIVFIASDLYAMAEGLRKFREVEPTRKALVILEELDEMLYSGSKQLSDMLDGPTSIGEVFYLATTNHIDRIPARMKRPSRFDRVVEMGPPSKEDRLEYFKAKLGLNESEDRLKEFAAKTEGFTFAHLKEFLVSVCCLGNDVDETIERLQNMMPEGMEYGKMEAAAFDESVTKLFADKKQKSEHSINESKTSRLIGSFK